jgi:hypothetical protein
MYIKAQANYLPSSYTTAPPISAMLKYVFVTVVTAIVNLGLVSTNNAQITNASVDIAPSYSKAVPEVIAPTIDRDKLITKDESSTYSVTAQKSDIKKIHRTLTEFYRGLNEQNVERMARVAVLESSSDKEYLRSTFARLKSYGIDMSIEVQNIELVSLSENNARVKVTQLMKARGSQRAVRSQQLASVMLVKYEGIWKVSDTDTVMKSLDRER